MISTMFMNTIAFIDWSTVNWTGVLAVIAVSLTAMGTLYAVFGKRDPTKSDQRLRESPFLRDFIARFNVHSDQQEECRQIIHDLKTEVAKLSVDNENTKKTLTDLRNDNREVVKRLDDLLKQLMEWLD